MKSGKMNFLEPSGPLQAYNGTALNFTFKREKKYFFQTSISFEAGGYVLDVFEPRSTVLHTTYII
jgi:hypothetical protein